MDKVASPDKLVTKPRIFTDEPEKTNLALDFNNYAGTISEIILESDPQFTVGIFGEWGSGKTTLLNKIQKILHSAHYTTVQFNAWRFEQETEHAKIPLLLNIIKALSDKIEKEIKIQETTLTKRQKVKDKVAKWAKNFLTSWSVTISTGIPGIINIDANTNSKKLNGEKEELHKITRPPLQEGFDLIEKLLKVDSSTKNKDLKLVVFIDDLDRCRPEKALQVFESIKIFFNIKGIVFVLALSKEIIEYAIKEKYKFVENKFSGREYLKKIIQLPFFIPTWEPIDIKNYVRMIIQKHPDEIYRKIFNDNIALITRCVEHNPREVKRYLNNFILSKYMNRNNLDLEDDKILLISALYMRWKKFLDAFFADPSILKKFKPILKMNNISNNLDLAKDPIEKMIIKDSALKDLLLNDGNILFEMDEKEIEQYKRVSSKFLSTLKGRLRNITTFVK